MWQLAGVTFDTICWTHFEGIVWSFVNTGCHRVGYIICGNKLISQGKECDTTIDGASIGNWGNSGLLAIAKSVYTILRKQGLFGGTTTCE